MQSFPASNDAQDAATRVSSSPLSRADRSQATDGRERRVHDRYSADLAIDFESDHNFYTGFTENISTGGLFVATRDILPIGNRFHITFTLPNYANPIVCECEVRWQRLEQLDNIECVPGMGVRFIDPSPRAQAAINEFLSQRESLFYDDEL